MGLLAIHRLTKSLKPDKSTKQFRLATVNRELAMPHK